MISFRAGLIGFVVAAVIFTTTSVLIAWTGPTSAPPNGNVSAPINTGTTDQVKNSGLSVNALAVFGNAILAGASSYLNFGSTPGDSGYGIRDNAGTIEFKSSGGTWSRHYAANGGLFAPSSVAVTTCNAASEGSLRYNSTSKTLEFCNGTTWSTAGSGGSSTSFTISSDTQNVNLYVLAGSPATAGTYTITINSGVTVGSANTATAAVVSGTWPTGSVVTLINNGNIYGDGGDGGRGNGASSPTCLGCQGTSIPGSAGGAGGPALSLSYNLIIDNTNGKIFGGGGGGGGGGVNASIGNGGSGGQGSAGGAAGAGGVHYNENGYSGYAGSVSGPGAARTTDNTYNHLSGGAGGAWATAGSAGEGALAGGAAGRAIILNGRTVTWLGGNDSTHVKGTVQ
jgi:hypothetical protein